MLVSPSEDTFPFLEGFASLISLMFLGPHDQGPPPVRPYSPEIAIVPTRSLISRLGRLTDL